MDVGASPDKTDIKEWLKSDYDSYDGVYKPSYSAPINSDEVVSALDSYYSRFITSLDSNRAVQSFTTLELLARRSGSTVNQLVTSISKFDDIDEAFDIETTNGV